jgi:histidine triad (HIT) family protein
MALLFRLARPAFGRFCLAWFFTHMSFALPVRRLRETATLIAFYHPQPSYHIHILLVPKRPLADLMALTTADADFLTDLFQSVQSLVTEFNLEPAGYRLIANGGAYQDIPYLHFHLIADELPLSR